MRIYSFSDVDNESTDRTSVDDLVLNEDGDFGVVKTVGGELTISKFVPTFVDGTLEIRDLATNNTIMSFSLDEVVFPGRVKSLAGDPISGAELVTKEYVDMSIAAAIAALGL